jgi:hypothetical protein
MIWLLKLFLPNWNTTVKVRRDHLPGLKAPTIAPKIPRKHNGYSIEKSNIPQIYDRYKAIHPHPMGKRPGHERGMDI